MGNFLNNNNKTPQAEGILSNNWVEGNFSQQQLPSVARDLVTPGDDIVALFMRGVITAEQRVALTSLYLKFEMMEFKEGLDFLKAWMAAGVSVDGKGREQLLVAGTGNYPPSWFAPQHKNKPFQKQKSKEEEEGD